MVRKKSPYNLKVGPELLKQIAPDPDAEFEVKVVGKSLVITARPAEEVRFKRSAEMVIAKYHDVLKSLAE